MWVVKTVRSRAAASASSAETPESARAARASSSAGQRGVALVEVHDAGSMPSAFSARTPPMPSSAYCHSRTSVSPT